MWQNQKIPFAQVVEVLDMDEDEDFKENQGDEVACNMEGKQSSNVDGIVSSDEVDESKQCGYKWSVYTQRRKMVMNNSPLSPELPTRHPNPVYPLRGQG